ncbi:MAG: CBS domain-containing protein [Candidatus Aenigmatarchaeota archaeon]
MLVKDIMSKDLPILNFDDKLTNFFSLMEKYHIHEAFVIKNKKFFGIITYKDIIRKGVSDPSKATVAKFILTKPMYTKPDDKIEDAAKILFKSGVRSIPVIDNSKIIGKISMKEIINYISGSKLFRQTKISEIAVKPITITIDTSIGKTRMIMKENDVSHLPVLDSNEKIVGIVTSFDFLKSLKSHEKMSFWEMAAEMERLMSIPVSTIMNTNPLIVDENISVSEAISEMFNKNVSYVILEKDKKISGIVTMKDIFELYISQFEKKGVYLQITGLGEEDEFIRSTIDRMLEDTVAKLNKIFEIQYVHMHVKKYGEIEPLPKRIKYSIRLKVKTKVGMFSAHDIGWDIRDAVGAVLDKIEKIIIEYKKLLSDEQRKNQIKIKRGGIE